MVRGLKRRRGGDQLLAFRSGPRWHHVTAADINDYIRASCPTASDFGDLATRGRAESSVLKLLTVPAQPRTRS